MPYILSFFSFKLALFFRWQKKQAEPILQLTYNLQDEFHMFISFVWKCRPRATTRAQIIPTLFVISCVFGWCIASIAWDEFKIMSKMTTMISSYFSDSFDVRSTPSKTKPNSRRCSLCCSRLFCWSPKTVLNQPTENKTQGSWWLVVLVPLPYSPQVVVPWWPYLWKQHGWMRRNAARLLGWMGRRIWGGFGGCVLDTPK